ASSLAVSAPTAATAGSALNVTVAAKDASGNTATGYTGTVHFTSSDGHAVLPADYTFTAADAGVHTFSVTLKTAGSRSVTATDTAAATITGSASVTVNPTGSSATLIKRDATTQGNWSGAYGAQGYNIVNNAASYPAYATV